MSDTNIEIIGIDGKISNIKGETTRKGKFLNMLDCSIIIPALKFLFIHEFLL